MRDCDCNSHGTFLTAKGLAEAAQRHSLEGLAPRGEFEYLDIPGSVSGLRRDETSLFTFVDSGFILDQSERFHNGS